MQKVFDRQLTVVAATQSARAVLVRLVVCTSLPTEVTAQAAYRLAGRPVPRVYPLSVKTQRSSPSRWNSP